MKKGGGGLRATAAVQYAWMQPQAQLKVHRRCRLLAVSRRGYSEGLRRPPRAQADADQQGHAKVHRYLAQGRGPYGTRRSKPLVAQEGLQVRRRRMGRWRAPAGLRCTTRRKDKAPTTAGQAQPVAPHQRNRACTVHAPEKV